MQVEGWRKMEAAAQNWAEDGGTNDVCWPMLHRDTEKAKDKNSK